MNLLNRVKHFTDSAVDSGKARIAAVRDERRRGALLTELGEHTYKTHRGQPVDETVIESVLAELDRLDAPTGADGDEAEPADDE